MHLHFWRQLKRFGLNERRLTQFYRSVIESVLSFGISVWFAGASSSDVDQLECIVRQVSGIVGGLLPSIASLYSTRLRSRARKITGYPTHPASCLCEPLSPSADVLQPSKLELVGLDTVFSLKPFFCVVVMLVCLLGYCLVSPLHHGTIQCVFIGK